MNAAHLHLILNHIPVVAMPLSAILLLIARMSRSPVMQKTALAFLIFVGFAAVATYLTGEPAADMLGDVKDLSGPRLEQHEKLALFAGIACWLIAGLAAGQLFLLRKNHPMVKQIAVALLVLSFLTSGLLAAVAFVGGQVRHTEIRE